MKISSILLSSILSLAISSSVFAEDHKGHAPAAMKEGVPPAEGMPVEEKKEKKAKKVKKTKKVKKEKTTETTEATAGSEMAPTAAPAPEAAK